MQDDSSSGIIERIPVMQYYAFLACMPIVCVDVVIEYNDKILLIKRRDEPAAGQWWIPGGRLYHGENLRDCALRKAKEEVDLDCVILRQIMVDQTKFETVHSVNIVYHLLAKEGKVTLDETCLDFKWVSAIDDDLHPYIKRCLGKIWIGI